MLSKALDMVLPSAHGERRLALLLFVHGLCAVGAFLTGRTVRDSLFLQHWGDGFLAWMYIGSAVGVTLVGFLYSRIAAGVRRDKLASSSALLFAAVFALAYYLEQGQPPWVYPALYVFVEVMGALVLVQFWTLANDLFNAREAKRLYGFIGAGGTFANIFIGWLGGSLAKTFGASSLLVLAALLLVATASAAVAAGTAGRQRLFARALNARPPGTKRPTRRKVVRSAHLVTIAVLTAVTYFTTTLVDFEFKVFARAAFQKDQLAEFFSNFSVMVGLLALFLQLFGTSRLLNRAGVIASLAVLPLSLGLGNVALLALPMLWTAAMAKGADTLFRYSVNDATTQILYLPVPPQARASSKAFIDSIVKPASIGFSGVFLLGYRQWVGTDTTLVTWVAVAMCALWLAVVVSLRSRYIRTLQDNLKQRRLDLGSARHQVLDGSTSTVLTRALASNDAREVLSALDLLPHLDNLELDHRVESLLDHANPQVRMAAVAYYGQRESMRFANSVFRRFDDSDPAVRAAAIDAFCAIGKDKAVRNVRQYLEDVDPRIRSAAVTGMIKFGGLDGVLVAAEALKNLINHTDAIMREHAARVLGDIGVQNFYQPVLQLMSDSESMVRRQAIAAAGRLKSPEFVIPLIYRTQSVETQQEAVAALTAYGPQVVPTLAKVLGNSLEEQAIRRAVARVLGRIGTPEAVAALAQAFGEPDEELRTALYKALARATRGKQLLLADVAPVQLALSKELERAYLCLRQAESLGLGSGAEPVPGRSGLTASRVLLASALSEKVRVTERRIFLLLSVLYPDADMERIWAGIYDAHPEEAPRRRANAVELLDNLLDRELKRRFLPLLDDVPRPDKLKAVADLIPLPDKSPLDTLLDLCSNETAWVRACALWCLAQRPGADIAQTLLERATDLSPVVREIALVALDEAAPEAAAQVAQDALSDDVDVVRRRAAFITTRRAQELLPS